MFNEHFEAWVLGPVVPKAYYEFCAYCADVILRLKDVELHGVKMNVLNNTLEKYANHSPYELVDKSRHNNGAWAKTYRNGKGRWYKIDFEIIKKLECSC